MTKNSNMQVTPKLRDTLQKEAQAEALFASIGDGAISTDDEGNIYQINQVALDLLGYKLEEVLGKWFPKIIVAQHEDGTPVSLMHRPISRSFLTGKAIREKMIYRRKNGTMLPVAVTVSPIMLRGKPVGAIEVFRDITEEREVDRMKTEFIYLASHQLRTPLTAAKTYAHMLNEGYAGKLSEDQEAFMGTITASLDRMNDIINTLLNVSRMEAGKMAITNARVSVADIVKEGVQELDNLIKGRRTQVVLSLPSLPQIKTDRVLIKEIILNLLSNAIKYTPHNGKVIIKLVEDDRGQLLSIIDNGYGIPDAAKDKLFTKFFRANNILDVDEGGTGLGLYLVRGIAKVLGAKLTYKSRENEGTAFYLRMPGSRDNQQTKRRPRPKVM